MTLSSLLISSFISDFNAENNSLVFNKAELIEEITATVLQKLDYKAEESAVKTTERRKNKLEFEEKIEETTVDVVKDEVTEDTVENEEVFEEARDAEVGKVDAVIIATDIGSEHVRRAKPFIEAGIPHVRMRKELV